MFLFLDFHQFFYCCALLLFGFVFLRELCKAIAYHEIHVKLSYFGIFFGEYLLVAVEGVEP